MSIQFDEPSILAAAKSALNAEADALSAAAKKLDGSLTKAVRIILDHPGKVSREVAKAFAESEFEKYRIVQDRLFESDFDRHIKKLLE